MKLINGIIGIIIIIGVLVGVFLMHPSQYNPLTPKGEIIGEFVNGSHRGYGEYCGQYPVTWIKLKNYTADGKDFYVNEEKVFCDFYFGCNWHDVDKLVKGERYRIWYHEESRPSDTTSGNVGYFWVIDGYETLKKGDTYQFKIV